LILRVIARQDNACWPRLSYCLAPTPLDPTLNASTSGPPEHGCDHSETRRQDGRGESPLGSPSDPRGIGQTGHRGVGADRTAPETTSSSTVTDVANLSDESRDVAGVHRLLHRADPHRSRAVCTRAAHPPSPTNRPPDDHRTSHSRMDGATGHRRLWGRHRAAMAAAGSRCHLWGRVPAPCRRHGHRRGHHKSIEPLAKSVRGASDRIPAPRVSGTTSSF
jgi:hypothetical protein